MELHVYNVNAEQDNLAEFRWRCFHSDDPANRFATPDCRALSTMRATRVTDEEAAFARIGRQIPRFVVEPQDARVTEGQEVRFSAQAEGVPDPTYQWFSVDRANNGHVLPGETNSRTFGFNTLARRLALHCQCNQ